MQFRQARFGLGLLLAFPAIGLAGDESRTACDGQSGKSQLACIQANYPKIYGTVEGLCAADEQPRQCRKREFASRGIAFVPSTQKGAGGGGTRATTAAEPVTYLTIRFVGAQIGPGTTDGSFWDGPGTIAPAAFEAMAALASGGASLAVGGVSGEAGSAAVTAATQGSNAPEVVGFVSVVGATANALASMAGNPMALATVSRTVQDSYTPTFPYQMEYRNWPVFSDTRFEVSLWDADMSEHDPIGVLQINADHLAAALAKKSIYEVPVADQTSGQVLSVKISVTPGSGSASPEMNGLPWQ